MDSGRYLQELCQDDLTLGVAIFCHPVWSPCRFLPLCRFRRVGLPLRDQGNNEVLSVRSAICSGALAWISVAAGVLTSAVTMAFSDCTN